ncbi:hypothetical protein BDY21DRAFT_371422 [Lineolata rhizophorae]|uniref:BTB domain-containing protein n=1 Tax=Lineolata rhizophorae TaxID=578093 RepID=A0A6A6P344_9PEZI|nr:hypothetical protein BDY21DRAFT_371422 [Lineolata rhizophorae]
MNELQPGDYVLIKGAGDRFMRPAVIYPADRPEIPSNFRDEKPAGNYKCVLVVGKMVFVWVHVDSLHEYSDEYLCSHRAQFEEHGAKDIWEAHQFVMEHAFPEIEYWGEFLRQTRRPQEGVTSNTAVASRGMGSIYSGPASPFQSQVTRWETFSREFVSSTTTYESQQQPMLGNVGDLNPQQPEGPPLEDDKKGKSPIQGQTERRPTEDNKTGKKRVRAPRKPAGTATQKKTAGSTTSKRNAGRAAQNKKDTATRKKRVEFASPPPSPCPSDDTEYGGIPGLPYVKTEDTDEPPSGVIASLDKDELEIIGERPKERPVGSFTTGLEKMPTQAKPVTSAMKHKNLIASSTKPEDTPAVEDIKGKKRLNTEVENPNQVEVPNRDKRSKKSSEMPEMIEVPDDNKNKQTGNFAETPSEAKTTSKAREGVRFDVPSNGGQPLRIIKPDNKDIIKIPNAGPNVVTVIVGKDTPEFFILPLESLKAHGHIVKEFEYTADSGILFDVRKSWSIPGLHFEPIAQFLREGEFTPKIVKNSSGDDELESVTKHDLRGQELLPFLSRVYLVAAQLQLMDIILLAFQKIVMFDDWPLKDALLLARCLWSRKTPGFEDECEPVMKEYVLDFLAERFDMYNLVMPEVFWEQLSHDKDLKIAVLEASLQKMKEKLTNGASDNSQ